MNPKDCIQKLIPSISELETPISDSMRSKILKELQHYKKRLAVMESHDLFKQLAGNPLSICILASFHKSDFFTNNDLASIYKRMTNQKSEHGETQEDE